MWQALIGYFSEWKIATWRNLVEWRVSDIRVQISKKKGCRIELETKFQEGCGK